MTFGARLRAALDSHGPLCVGIDPHDALLNAWGLESSAAGVREFGLRVVEASASQVGVVKPQVAFFERFGSAGFAALEEVLAACRAAGLISIADAKRGDIGSTMAGYAQAWLSAGAPLEADALTVSPYLGPESLSETIDVAQSADKGLFVLAGTSNPEAGVLQQARTNVEGETVALRVVRDVARGAADAGLASVGVVIGVTADREGLHLSDDDLARMPILAPGFGAQGAVAADLTRVFGVLSGQVLANESRSVLSAGPQKLKETIAAAATTYREVLRG